MLRFILPLFLAGCSRYEEPVMLTIAYGEAGVEGIAADGVVHHFDADLRDSEGPGGPAPRVGITACAFSTGGKFMAIADGSNLVKSGEVGKPSSRVVKAKSPVSGVAVSASGKQVAVQTTDGLIRIYEGGGEQSSFARGKTLLTGAMSFSPDDATLAVGTTDGILLLKASDCTVHKSCGPRGTITALAFDPTGKLAYGGAMGETTEDPAILGALDLDGSTIAEWKGNRPHETARSIAFDGKILVSASPGMPLRSFRLEGGKLSPR